MFIKELLEKFPNIKTVNMYIEEIGYTLPIKVDEIEPEYVVNTYNVVGNDTVYVNEPDEF